MFESEQRTTRPKRVQVLSLGYEKRSLAEVVGILASHGIRLVVDVRRSARSRKPGFSGPALALRLQEAGIGYEVLPELGCAPAAHQAFRENADRHAYFAAYRRSLEENGDAYGRLGELAAPGGVAILCMERRREDCHRQVLAQELEHAGFDVREA